jgi:hypothetical protein
MTVQPNSSKTGAGRDASSSERQVERKNSWVTVKGGPVIAVIDMGTNSFHMIVCQASPDKDHFEVLAKVKEAVPFFVAP